MGVGCSQGTKMKKDTNSRKQPETGKVNKKTFPNAVYFL